MKRKNFKKFAPLKLLTTIPIHPFLFAIFPILFFYSNNINEVFLDVLPPPVIFTTAFTVVSFLILNFFFKNRFKAGLSVSLFLVLFFSYGHIQTTIGDFNLGIGNLNIGKDKLLVPIWVGSFLLGAYLLVRTRKNLRGLSNSLNIISALLVGFSLVNIIYFEFSTNRIARLFAKDTKNVATVSTKLVYPENPPDIYYLIFDRYAGNSTLKELYNFDNSEFTNYLTSKGFYIPNSSVANYPITDQSLASSLNMEYINYLKGKVGENSSDRTVVYPMLEDYKVWRLLKSKGYRFLHVGPLWEPTRVNKFADNNYSSSNNLNLDEFSTKLLNTTLFSPIVSKFFGGSSVSGPKNNHRDQILYQFSKLEEIPAIKGPKFVFSHMLIPHDPYVFGHNCEPLEAKEVKKRSKRENYINQLSCTNKKIKLLVNQLLANSKKPPIIIIQADEGPYPAEFNAANNFNLKNADEETLKEKLGILNAYYLPDADKSVLYPSITPVNSFRLIFNLYFGTNYELLPDKSYIFEDINHLYKYTDVTKKLRGY